MSSLKLINCQHFAPSEMISSAKPRCQHSQLLMDHQMKELWVVNGPTLEVDFVVKYPTDVDEFEVHDFIVTLDGQYCYLFPNEPRDFFLSIDLENKQADKIWYSPEFGGTYLCWFLPTGLFLGRDHSSWIIKGDRLVRANQEECRLRFPEPLRAAINEGYAIEKAGNNGDVYVRGPANDSIGKVTSSGQFLLMPQEGEARDVTSDGIRLFVSSPDGVAEYTDKRRRILLRTNSDIVFNSINIISSPHEKLLSILGWEGDDTVLWNYHISNYDWF